MKKKFEYGQKYPDVVYKRLVKKWFNDHTNSLSDADMQKFVNNAMMGKLTFQCAYDIGLDDPDIDVIDHLLMDIASEKNDELINTYTDEIDWDNNYIEKSYYKNLESRIAMLEKRFTSYGLTDVTWDDYLDKDIVVKVRNMVYNKIGDEADVSEVFNFHSYDDGNGNFIRLYTFEVENKAEEWDNIEEYGETWDDWGGAEAYAEDKDTKQYTLLSDHGKICVVYDRLMGSGPSNELGTYSSVEEAANAIVKSRLNY